MRYRVIPRVELMGYAVFFPGHFTRTAGRDDVTHFAYLELYFAWLG